jgi:hypothetical protein
LILREVEGGGLLIFFCPGCQMAHHVRIPPTADAWTWNGNMEKPTFEPSIKTGWWKLPDPIPKGEDGRALVDDNGRIKGAVEITCHSFVRDGQIQFLDDCGHELKGQTVPMPHFPDWYK